MRAFFIVLFISLIPGAALARNVEAGSMLVSAGVGGGIKMASPLGGDGTGGHLLLMAQGEYALSKALGAVVGVNLGLGSIVPLRLRLGGRYRLTDLGLPVVPYGQVQLSVGELFNVIGADLTTLGVHVAVGADYFLTADLAVGGSLGFDLSSTFGDRPAFYGTFEFMAVATYVLPFGQPAPALEEG